MAFVQYGHLTEAEREAEHEQRRLAEAIKEIEGLHASQINALTTWLRHRDHPTGVAQRALEQLGNARREENLLLKNVLGIEPGRPSITKGQRQ